MNGGNDSTKTVALSCILFTLEGTEVSKNKYVDIFLCWMSQLASTGGLQRGDALYIHCDIETKEYIHEHTVFLDLASLCRIQVNYIHHNQPKSAREGMMWKYTIFDYPQDVFFYCDIDVLVLKSVHSLTDRTPDECLVVQRENCLLDPNYSAAFTTEELSKFSELHSGISAGKFMIRGKALHTEFCAHVEAIAAEHPDSTFYTVEQPFFVKAVYRFLPFCNVTLLDPPVVSINWDFYDQTKTILLDSMGEPGNGDSHLKKQLDAILLLHASSRS
jgi:hypothetical protein